MSENEIRQILQKIKLINKKFVSYYYASEFDADDDLSDISGRYIETIKDLIGSINKVKSERILKALGFEKISSRKYQIPVNSISLIENGTSLVSLDGNTVVVGKDDICLDSRNGMLGYTIEFESIWR